MPRIDPVPTAPAPPIWNTDLGRIPPVEAISRSVRRWYSGSPGRRRPGRPQNGGSQSASHFSPARSASCQRAGPPETPREVRNHPGSENAKSRPTTSSGARAASSMRWLATLALVLPASSRTTSPPAVASASQIFFSAPVRAPDQSTAMTRIAIKPSYWHGLTTDPENAEQRSPRYGPMCTCPFASLRSLRARLRFGRSPWQSVLSR